MAENMLWILKSRLCSHSFQPSSLYSPPWIYCIYIILLNGWFWIQFSKLVSWLSVSNFILLRAYYTLQQRSCHNVQHPTFALFSALSPHSNTSHYVSTCYISIFLFNICVSYSMWPFCNIYLINFFVCNNVNFIDSNYTLLLSILNNHVAQLY